MRAAVAASPAWHNTGSGMEAAAGTVQSSLTAPTRALAWWTPQPQEAGGLTKQGIGTRCSLGRRRTSRACVAVIAIVIILDAPAVITSIVFHCVQIW